MRDCKLSNNGHYVRLAVALGKYRIYGALTALSVAFAVHAQPAVTQTPPSPAKAAAEIDWNSVTVLSAIPESMPAQSSDDPVEAGFAREWIERSVLPAVDDTSKSLVMKIATLRRNPNDKWAISTESALRQLIGSTVPHAKHPRVFCNAVGCLVYVERDLRRIPLSAIVATEHSGPRGRELGIKKEDLGHLIHAVWGPGIPWELTVIRRPTGTSP
jgi:hypothetical protein